MGKKNNLNKSTGEMLESYVKMERDMVCKNMRL